MLHNPLRNSKNFQTQGVRVTHSGQMVVKNRTIIKKSIEVQLNGKNINKKNQVKPSLSIQKYATQTGTNEV